MRFGNFSLMIPEGRERDSGHVVLSHGQMYTLRLGNHCYRRRCDATVFVDGKEVGCFRLSAGQIWTIERPAHDTGRFTFFRSDSAEAATAGVGAVKQEDRGLVHVVFRPELCREEKRSGPLPREIFESHISVDQPQFLMRSCNADAPKNLSSGITGLTGQSRQTFRDVPALDYDPDGETVITLRLVSERLPVAEPVRPLTATPRCSPVPAAVD